MWKSYLLPDHGQFFEYELTQQPPTKLTSAQGLLKSVLDLTNFALPQQDIIASVLEQRNTLAISLQAVVV